MTACGIDVFIAQDVGDQINIARFIIEHCAKGGTEFMRRYFLEWRDDGRVFFHKLLNCALTDSFVLQREKERLFMSWHRFYFFAFF